MSHILHQVGPFKKRVDLYVVAAKILTDWTKIPMDDMLRSASDTLHAIHVIALGLSEVTLRAWREDTSPRTKTSRKMDDPVLREAFLAKSRD